MQAILFTSATVSQGTMLSLESKVAINCKKQKGSPVYLATSDLADAAGSKHRERAHGGKSLFSCVPSSKDICEKIIHFGNWRPGPISASFRVWQIGVGLPRNTIQASSREFWREVWTWHLFGRRYPRGEREMEAFLTLNIQGAIQIDIWHTRLN